MTFNRSFIFFIIFAAMLISITGLPVEFISNAAKYAQVSREILINQNWINLTIAEAPYDQKPPLLFWVGAFSFQLFGFSVTAYKAVVIFISLLGIYSTYKLGKLLYGKKTGLLATAFWVTSVAYLNFHNAIHTDTLLTTFVVFSVWQFALFFRNRKWHHFLWGSVGVGLAMLTKGPVGMAIPAFAVGTDLLLYLIVLSIAKQKNPHYMLAVVPFIFILSAKWALKIMKEKKKGGTLPTQMVWKNYRRWKKM